jgi:pimeloyl-ACP methyl ester carboxylesterase
VFLHGLGSASSADFPAIVHRPGLSGFRSILPDFLGFGFSDRPYDFSYTLEAHAESVAEILKYLKLAGVCLFGHSMGGAVAVALTAVYPKLVSQLVLAEANLDPGVGSGSKIIAEQAEADYVASGHRQFMMSIKKEMEKEPGLSSYLGSLAIADPLAMHKSAVGLIKGTRPSQRELFQGMKIPRAFIFGEKSLPDPDAENLGKAGIKTLIVSKAGHAMMDDNPDGFTAALIEAFGL